ncbi:MAG: (Fe-S)-binding protein, partial [Desulfamplus sp.]|nr:(Fe-S)-binding protein [Desulfamplus sp.]
MKNRTPQNPQNYTEIIKQQCINCPKCVAQCAFLKQYGTPAKIAESYLASIEQEDGAGKSDESKNWLEISYQCSLCGLCSAVCPVKLSPEKMFLEMRREAVTFNIAPLPEHNPIIAYEKKGASKRYSWYSLPQDCHTVLFPGCTFAGTRSDTTLALYEHLKSKEPTLGIVLDCCCKPSHDLGRASFFDEMFGEMRSWLIEHGVKTIIVVCPNCYKVFKSYGSPLEVVSAYERLLEHDLVPTATLPKISSFFSIHDPCVLRNEPQIQNAVRIIAQKIGFSTKEMPHSRQKSLCCGEGGSVGFVAPEFASNWGEIRKNEATNNGGNLLTYCAGCAGFLNKRVPTHHIIDAIFYPESVEAGTRKVSKAPFTYINRIKLKSTLKDKYLAPVTRERDFKAASDKESSNKWGSLKKIMILAIIIAAVAGIRFSGLLDNFDSDTLRKTVADWGAFAPIIYMLIYAVAPVLFL